MKILKNSPSQVMTGHYFETCITFLGFHFLCFYIMLLQLLCSPYYYQNANISKIANNPLPPIHLSPVEYTMLISWETLKRHDTYISVMGKTNEPVIGITTIIKWKNINYLNANLTKWSNTLKQFVACQPKNCLSVFDNILGLALKELKDPTEPKKNVEFL